jgi:hypothetical protein
MAAGHATARTRPSSPQAPGPRASRPHPARGGESEGRFVEPGLPPWRCPGLFHGGPCFFMTFRACAWCAGLSRDVPGSPGRAGPPPGARAVRDVPGSPRRVGFPATCRVAHHVPGASMTHDPRHRTTRNPDRSTTNPEPPARDPHPARGTARGGRQPGLQKASFGLTAPGGIGRLIQDDGAAVDLASRSLWHTASGGDGSCGPEPHPNLHGESDQKAISIQFCTTRRR